jgi:hypothetical protein
LTVSLFSVGNKEIRFAARSKDRRRKQGQDMDPFGFLGGVAEELVAAAVAGTAGLGVGYWLQRRRIVRLKRKLAAFEKDRGTTEVALLLAVRGEDIETPVRDFIGADMPLFKVMKKDAFSESEEDWLAFAREIRKRSSEIRQSGATRVHLFMMTPVTIGVFAGAILDGGPEVVVYHYFNGCYRRVGSLAQEAVVA